MLHRLIHRVNIADNIAPYETLCLGDGLITVALVYVQSTGRCELSITHRPSGRRIHQMAFSLHPDWLDIAVAYRDELLALDVDWGGTPDGEHPGLRAVVDRYWLERRTRAWGLGLA